jgi:hypothetical protein
MTETFFPTSTPATIDELYAKLAASQDELSRCKSQTYSLQAKIDSAREIIVESYDGDYDETVVLIAEALDIYLTKHIHGEGTVHFSFSAIVPYDFDESILDFDIDISDSFDNDDIDIEINDTDWSVNH